MDFCKGNRPQLLVSVRNPSEARSAILGGAEIIDIKEPARGSLGKADDAVIAHIVHTVRELDPAIPISAALGELHEWEEATTIPTMSQDVGFVKLGLSRLARTGDWKDRWRTFRDCFERLNPHSPAWVMVSYADWIAADAPSPKVLMEAAPELDCRMVLLDTFAKTGRTLLDILSLSELVEIQAASNQKELPLALAGSLRAEDLRRLDGLSPDIIAIRSAACWEGDRNGSICPVAVSQFRNQLQAVFSSERCFR